MAVTYRVLGQSLPALNTVTTMYTVPVSTQVVTSTLGVCNQSADSGLYRVAIRPNGESLAAKHWIVYDATLPGKTTDALTLGMTLAAGDVVSIFSSNGSMSFHLFGSELT